MEKYINLYKKKEKETEKGEGDIKGVPGKFEEDPDKTIDLLRNANEDANFGRRNSLSRTPPVVTEVPAGFHTTTDRTESEGNALQDEDLLSSPGYKLVAPEELLSVRQGQKKDLARTPPKTSLQRRNSLPSPKELIGYVTQPAKCMREDSPLQGTSSREEWQLSKEMMEIKTIMLRVERTYKELMRNITQTPKTKVEIREAAKGMKTNMEILSRKIEEYGEKQHVLSDNIKIKDTRTVEVQVSEEDIEEEAERTKVKIEKEIMDTLQMQHSVEKLKTIIDYEWTEETFKRTSVIEGDLQDLSIHNNVAFIVNNKSRKIPEEIGKRYPEVENIVKEGLVEGQIEFIRENRQVETSKGDRGHKCNTSYILPFNIDKSGITDIEALYAIIKQLSENMEMANLKSIILGTLEGKLDKGYLRKIVEYIFHKTEIEVHLIVKKTLIVGTKKPTKNDRKDSEKVIVKCGGKSYADLLKQVKGTVKLDESGIQIKTIKKTRSGDLLLEVEGKKEKAVALKNMIKSQSADTEVLVKSRDSILHMTDIDASIQEDELKRDIQKTWRNLKEEDIKVLSMRPTQNGNQAATIAVRKDIADNLASRGKVKVGWVMCRIRKRVTLNRCFRCLQFGHKKDECAGEDRTDNCLKCGQAGHKVKECINPPFCLKCGIEGHRQDQTRCPNYRALIKEKTKTMSTLNSELI